MASLRQLLDIAPAEYFDSLAQPAFLEWADESVYFMNRCTQVFDTDNDKSCFDQWVVPDDARLVTFEAWGGGGGGAGSCGCAFGWPGGSGAYARQTVRVTETDITGEQYLMCVGPATCCSSDNTCGFRGCTSFITGTGLTNFCAEGGLPGCTQLCIHNNFPVNDACGMYQAPNYDTECACYYGTNCGIPGRHSQIIANCDLDGNWCAFQQVFRSPGGLNSSGNSLQVMGAHCNIVPDCDRCRPGHFAAGMFGGTREYIAVGMGGNSSRACGDGCCCGYPGGPGLIKISWSY